MNCRHSALKQAIETAFMKIPLAPLAILLATGTLAFGEESISFNRDVRPILSDKCFFCHGPDAKKREADLRLDDRSVAIKAGAIVAGKPAESELVRRILSTDADERMPPPASKLDRLTEQEVATLRRWIEQGAEYENHWAFIPLKPGIPPKSTAEAGDATTAAIDRAVMEGLAKRGLGFQPEADRGTLIRRVSFDLTGLPPSAAEVEAFVADAAPDAYERLVDRLLKSEHYGERMAVDWLDAARYADSYGFQVDRERDMWPWRDWVVRAFNANQPFDQFITQQLAGDLLPDPSDEQILATAFNRLHQQESEGGSVEEEYRVEYICDRVQTFATTFLGLTFECARCHDHKFDPIAQREYYQFFAMFQNIDEAGLYSFFTSSAPTPALALTDEPTKRRLADLRAKLHDLENRSADLRQARRASFDQWLADLRSQARSEPKESEEQLGTDDQAPFVGEIGRFRFDSIEKNLLKNDVASDKPATLRGENKLVPGHDGQAIEFTGDDPVDLPLGNFGRHEPFSIALWLKTPDEKERAVVFHRSRAWTDAGSRGYELLIEQERLNWSLIHFWPGNAISIAAIDRLPLDEWVHVVVSSDGSSRVEGLKLFINGRPAPVEIVKSSLTKEITGGGGDNIALGERFRDRGFKGGTIDDFRVFHRKLTPPEAEAAWRGSSARAIVAGSLGEPGPPATNERLFDFYLATVDAEWPKHLAALQAARPMRTSWRTEPRMSW